MVEEDRVESTVATVDADPEAAAEVAAIIPPHQIKIKVYELHSEKTSSTMVIKSQQTRWGRIGRRLSTMSAPYMGTTSATNYRTKQSSPYPSLNILEMYS